MPGLLTNIAVERTFRFNLPKPYSNCEIDNTSPGYFDSELYNMIANSDYEYNQQFCFKQCIQKETIKRCNCSHPYSASLFASDRCISQAQLDCSDVLKYDLNWNDFISANCLSECPLECEAIEYHNSVSSIGLVGDYYADVLKARPRLVSDFVTRPVNAQTARDSIVVLNIFYDSLSYTKYTEIPQMDTASLFSSIGGNLSLFLGLSVFSFFELIEVFLEAYFIYS